MPGIYEYIIQMQDRASGTLQKLTGTSFETMQKLTGLQDKVKALDRNTKDFGGSIYNLKQKVDILQQKRDLIDPSNLTKIRQYNKEIKGLTTSINRLENTSGSKFSKWTKDAINQIPGGHLLTNPIVMAGAGVAAVGKLGVSWEDGMAKINTTAQLPQKQLDSLSKKIKRLGVDAGANLAGVPDAYEKIISQTGDAALSTDILTTSLKGAKAGYADIDIVSGAVAQSLSAIGKGKETAAEVMDVLFAAKRVGAGEFTDFASNIPGLIASGNNVGVTFREVSGVFAYMTGKGNNAANSTMLLQNAFTALGKSEITEGLEKAGVAVYDSEGKMKGLLPIMEDLSRVMDGFGNDDKAKSNFLESIGLRDAQAKQAFSILTGETDKLRTAMDATANASGEMDAALDKVDTTGNKLREGWSKIQGLGLSLGGVVLQLLNPALDLLVGLLTGLNTVVGWIGTAWDWWNDKLESNSPLITGLTVLIAGLTGILTANAIVASAASIGYGLAAVAAGIWSAATWVATAAQWALNAAMTANPLSLIVLVIMALVAAVYAAWQKFEGFRKVVMGVWEVVKNFGNILKSFVIDRITGILKGIGSLGTAIRKLFEGDFKGAWQSAKDGAMDLSGINAYKNAGEKIGAAWAEGKHKGAVSWKNSQYKENDNGFRFNQDNPIQDQSVPDFGSTSIYGNKKNEPFSLLVKNESEKDTKGTDDLLENLSGSGKNTTKNNTSDTLSLGLPQNYGQTNTYASITAKLGGAAPVTSAKQNTNEKPVKTIAMRVDEMGGSLKKIAAAVSVPLIIGAGVANASPNELMPMKTSKVVSNETTIAPVSNSINEGNVYNAFNKRLTSNKQQLNRVNSVSTAEENSLFNQVSNATNDNRKSISEVSQQLNRVNSVSTAEENSLFNQVASTTTDNRKSISEVSQQLNRVNSVSTAEGNSLFNSVSNAPNYNNNTLANSEENSLFNQVSSVAENYQESVSIDDSKHSANKTSAVNTTNNQGRTINMDRFTDKIEIHVSGQDAPQQAAEQVRIEVEKALAEIFNV